MPLTPIAAADYVDALIAAQHTKNLLFLLLLGILVGQVAMFFGLRYGTATTAVTRSIGTIAVEYFIDLTLFAGLVLGLMLTIVVLLLSFIMLAGRLMGTGKMVSAAIWCAFLLILLFPWQLFLSYPGLEGNDFRIPGVLYTWAEVCRDGHFNQGGDVSLAVGLLKWARFVGFPILSIFILFLIQAKTRSGLRRALTISSEVSDLGSLPI